MIISHVQAEINRSGANVAYHATFAPKGKAVRNRVGVPWYNEFSGQKVAINSHLLPVDMLFDAALSISAATFSTASLTSRLWRPG